jgi:hypothetical protein
MAVIRNAYSTSVIISESKVSLGRSRYGLEDNIKINDMDLWIGFN